MLNPQTSAPVKNTSSPYRTYSLPAFTPAEIDAMIFARIVWHCAGKGLCWVSDPTLAKDLGLTLAEVSESVMRQWQAGELGIEQRHWRRYLLIAQTSNFTQFESPYKKKDQEEEREEEFKREEERRNNNKQKTVVASNFDIDKIDKFRSMLAILGEADISEEDYHRIVESPGFAFSLGLDPDQPYPFPEIPSEVAATLPDWLFKLGSESSPKIVQPIDDKPVESTPEPSKAIPIADNGTIVAKLTERGIKPLKVAEDLAKKFPPTDIERHIAAYDLGILSGKVRSPGFLRDSILGEYDHAHLKAAEKRQEQSRQRDEGIVEKSRENAKERAVVDRKQTYWDNLSPDDQAVILSEAEANLRDRGFEPDLPRKLVWRGFVGIEKWAIIDKRLGMT